MASILLVEDEEFLRTAIAYILTAEGHQVLEASDGQEGVDLFTQQLDEIDLVLSDLMMPCLDGLAMLQILRCLRPQVKQILITGSPLDAQAWCEQGIHDWMLKPFEPEQLLSKVKTVLAA